MTDTEKLRGKLRKLPLGTKEKRFGEDEYLCLNDSIVSLILQACKEAGLMFTQITRYPEDVPLPPAMKRSGIESWEYREIIGEIEI